MVNDVLDTELVKETLRPLSRAEYDRLIQLGWFVDERIELLRGCLVTMSPQGTRHAEVIRRLNRILGRVLADRALVQIQSPIAASDDSEPEPDVAVIPIASYTEDHPRQAWLVIEVAESSLGKDRNIKSQLYAACDVTEYWIVNVPAREVEVHTEPHGDGYRICRRFTAGEEIALARFPEVVVRVDDIIPE
jgi:Uma2 family endonuclease